MKRLAFTCLSAVTLIGLVYGGGCSKEATDARVSGQVKLNGSPVAIGVILFQDDANGIGGSAIVENGQYTFTTPLVPGHYSVALQPPPPPPPHEMSSNVPKVKLPSYLTVAATSGLTVDVTPGQNSLDFDINSNKR